MGLKGGEITPKHGEKEKFSFGVICDEKSEKSGSAAYSGYAAALPAYFPQAPQSCKVAHRGRHGTTCPAMPTLRFLSNSAFFVRQSTS